jgi:hypothetical protein
MFFELIPTEHKSKENKLFEISKIILIFVSVRSAVICDKNIELNAGRGADS